MSSMFSSDEAKQRFESQLRRPVSNDEGQTDLRPLLPLQSRNGEASGAQRPANSFLSDSEREDSPLRSPPKAKDADRFELLVSQAKPRSEVKDPRPFEPLPISSQDSPLLLEPLAVNSPQKAEDSPRRAPPRQALAPARQEPELEMFKDLEPLGAAQAAEAAVAAEAEDLALLPAPAESESESEQEPEELPKHEEHADLPPASWAAEKEEELPMRRFHSEPLKRVTFPEHDEESLETCEVKPLEPPRQARLDDSISSASTRTPQGEDSKTLSSPGARSPWTEEKASQELQSVQLKQQLEELEEQQKQIQHGLKEALDYHRRLWADELARCREASVELEQALEEERRQHAEHIREWQQKLQDQLTATEAQWREEAPRRAGSWTLASGGVKRVPAWVKEKARAGARAKADARGGSPKAKAKAKAKAAAAKAAARTGRAAAKSAARAESPRGAKRKASDASIGKPARGSSPKARGKGGKEVDKHVPGAGGFKVYEDYSVKLNQTNIAGNNNKYYVIQVLVGGGQYHAWNRWGRVGESGATKLKTFGTPEAAIKDFKSKFREKSANAWEYIDDFKPKKGKYIIVETEEGGGGGDAPMGKLTEKQIVKGQGVLDKIEAALKKKGKSALDDLSSEYFSLIPHDFGRKRPTSINTVDLLQQQQELLKFYLRMGFEEVESKHMSPVEGVLELPVPASLDDAAGSVAKSHQIKEKLLPRWLRPRLRQVDTESATFGAKLAKKQAGKPKRKMTDKEYGAILLYTSNAIYKDLNQTLRDNNRGKLKKYFKYLRLFFESMDALPKQKRKLWRGLQVDLHKSPQYKVGSTVVWWGISSCTSDQGVAKGFAQGCGGECTLITVESKTAADISQVTFYSNEKESLLSPGTEFKVKSNKMNGKVCEITLEEMGRQLN
ncbi:unnamed protein product [Effrenium voratum]|nr:unnamed protein product [Effrenium voratum]